MHLSPGNSKVNAPRPLEIPRFLNRGAQIIIGIAYFNKRTIFIKSNIVLICYALLAYCIFNPPPPPPYEGHPFFGPPPLEFRRCWWMSCLPPGIPQIFYKFPSYPMEFLQIFNDFLLMIPWKFYWWFLTWSLEFPHFLV
jgi:hypothetical protein